MYKIMWCCKGSKKIMSLKVSDLASVIMTLKCFSDDDSLLHVFPYDDYNNKRCVKC